MHFPSDASFSLKTSTIIKMEMIILPEPLRIYFQLKCISNAIHFWLEIEMKKIPKNKSIRIQCMLFHPPFSLRSAYKIFYCLLIYILLKAKRLFLWIPFSIIYSYKCPVMLLLLPPSPRRNSDTNFYSIHF